MAVSLGSDEKKGRKAVDAELILVPYIDLLTCMVAFLLITAVWSQLARLSVAQKGQGGDIVGIVDGLRLSVLVHPDGFNVVVADQQKPIPKRGDALDYAALGTELARIKEAHPDATDASILSEDGIVFDTIVHTMDVAMAAGFPELSLLEAAQGR